MSLEWQCTWKHYLQFHSYYEMYWCQIKKDLWKTIKEIKNFLSNVNEVLRTNIYSLHSNLLNITHQI